MNNKVNMNYRYRRFVIIILIIAILVFAGLLIYKILYPGYEDKDNIILQGKGYSNIDYQVALLPNDIYDESTISGMDYYLSPFTRFIKMYTNAGVSAAGADSVTCVSKCNLYLMSKVDKDGVLETIWSKEYPCLEERIETSEEGAVDIERVHLIYLDEYNELISDLIDNYSIYTIYEVHAVFSGEFIVEKNGITQSVPFTSSLTMNLNDSVYQIRIIDHDDMDVMVKRSYKAEKAIDWYAVLIFIGVALIFASILSYILLKTIAVREIDVYHNKVAVIMREYHSRLAQLSKTLTYQASVMISIERFEDLIKIADEIGQMVFYYEVNETDERKIEFYVFDDARIYYLVMFG